MQTSQYTVFSMELWENDQEKDIQRTNWLSLAPKTNKTWTLDLNINETGRFFSLAWQSNIILMLLEQNKTLRLIKLLSQI